MEVWLEDYGTLIFVRRGDKMNYSSKIGFENGDIIQPRFCFACYHNCSLSCNTTCKGGCSSKCDNGCSKSCGNNCTTSCISSMGV